MRVLTIGKRQTEKELASEIGKRKAAEAGLKHSRHVLDLFLQSTPASIVMFDRDMRYLAASRRFREERGVGEQDLIGRNHYEVFPDLPESWRETHRRCLAGATVQREPEPVTLAGGKTVWIQQEFWPWHDEEGAIGGIIGVIEMVTERVRAMETLRVSEARFRGFLEASPDTIIITDAQGRIVLASPRVETLLGYKPEELLGEPIATLMPERYRARHGAYVRDYFARPATRAAGTGTVLTARHRDGSEFPVEITLSPYRDSDAMFVIAAMHDVTQRLEIEERLRQAEKMEAVGNLTGGIAHDFNNVLGVVIGNVDLLKQMLADNPLAKELCDEALEGAARGADLIRQMLAFARRQPLRPVRTDVNALIARTAKLLGRTLGAEIALTTRLDPETWPVMVDAAQLQAALINLATNARDAMPQGGKLDFTATNTHLAQGYVEQQPEVTPGDYVVIEVSDTGVGIAPEKIGRIFEPFYTTKDAGRGTGLGLSMIFGFVKQSGGHISVYSKPGMGTVFKLYLPRDRSDAAGSPAEAGHRAVAGGSETVLVVEDDTNLRRVTVQQLTMLGYRVREAETAAAALRALESDGGVDLLFSDVVMPGGMDGLALAREVTRLHAGIKVLLTSGFMKVSGAAQQLSACEYRVLSKPYRHDELARAVRAMLDG